MVTSLRGGTYVLVLQRITFVFMSRIIIIITGILNTKVAPMVQELVMSYGTVTSKQNVALTCVIDFRVQTDNTKETKLLTEF